MSSSSGVRVPENAPVAASHADSASAISAKTSTVPPDEAVPADVTVSVKARRSGRAVVSSHVNTGSGVVAVGAVRRRMTVPEPPAAPVKRLLLPPPPPPP